MNGSVSDNNCVLNCQILNLLNHFRSIAHAQALMLQTVSRLTDQLMISAWKPKLYAPYPRRRNVHFSMIHSKHLKIICKRELILYRSNRGLYILGALATQVHFIVLFHSIMMDTPQVKTARMQRRIRTIGNYTARKQPCRDLWGMHYRTPKCSKTFRSMTTNFISLLEKGKAPKLLYWNYWHLCCFTNERERQTVSINSWTLWRVKWILEGNFPIHRLYKCQYGAI